jgi:pyruvate dehydrogenase E2 component (dihydrolipoamide acetyltransferase)
LAVGTSVPRVYSVGENYNLSSVNTLRVTISADRRVVDEEIAERFLSAFKKYIENPTTLIL